MHFADMFVKSENIRTANTASQTNNTSATITVGEGHGFKVERSSNLYSSQTCPRLSNANYKVKALIGTTEFLSTLEGNDIALGTDYGNIFL